MNRLTLAALVALALSTGCATEATVRPDGGDAATPDVALTPGDVTDAAVGPGDAASDVPAPQDVLACGDRATCEALWERNAAARLAEVVDAPVELASFLRAVPKGADLHQHLSGSVYAETMLEWGRADGNCINNTSLAAVARSQCAAAGNLPAPAEGMLFDRVLRAWSMLDFMPGAVTGHDHFFATFGKFGVIAGAHRDDSLADIVARAARENQLYIETMFNLGTNVGSLAASLFSGSVTVEALPMFYENVVSNPGFAAQLDRDVAAVTGAASRYRTTLGCDGATPPPACGVRVRFVAQVSRTGGNDQIFGQLISAFEMAARTPQLVAVNLSSPEDDPASLRNYDLHMAMLDLLYNRYRVTGRSPLHITLHAGEITPRFLPPGYANHNTFHIRRAVEVGHAERIGHGIAVLSETDAEGLLRTMRERGVMVEVCLSSNDQILEVRGQDHPLSRYITDGVPVALATDDQGVSRSSLAGEYARAVRDQGIEYRQLKAMARASLEHAFLPGASLWVDLGRREPVAVCAPTERAGLGESPGEACADFLRGSERAQLQWELEGRFRTFERAL